MSLLHSDRLTSVINNSLVPCKNACPDGAVDKEVSNQKGPLNHAKYFDILCRQVIHWYRMNAILKMECIIFFMKFLYHYRIPVYLCLKRVIPWEFHHIFITLNLKDLSDIVKNEFKFLDTFTFGSNLLNISRILLANKAILDGQLQIGKNFMFSI